MEELILWLRGVLVADEAFAQATAQGAWRWSDPQRPEVYVEGDGNRTIARCANGYPEDLANARHITLHDPPAVLADIAAKRAILDLCDELPALGVRLAPEPIDDEPEYAYGRGRGIVQAVRLLASAYADRPGYREEWRPHG